MEVISKLQMTIVISNENGASFRAVDRFRQSAKHHCRLQQHNRSAEQWFRYIAAAQNCQPKKMNGHWRETVWATMLPLTGQRTNHWRPSRSNRHLQKWETAISIYAKRLDDFCICVGLFGDALHAHSMTSNWLCVCVQINKLNWRKSISGSINWQIDRWGLIKSTLLGRAVIRGAMTRHR